MEFRYFDNEEFFGLNGRLIPFSKLKIFRKDSIVSGDVLKLCNVDNGFNLHCRSLSEGCVIISDNSNVYLSSEDLDKMVFEKLES